MVKRWLERISGKELLIFSVYSLVLLLLAASLRARPPAIAQGMLTIVLSRDALITDYFALAGHGAAFLNAALVLGIAVFLVVSQNLPFTGITMSALFISAGYALWGKNPLNILPILLGTFLYAKFHKASFRRYVYTALYGTCLAPLVTEMVYILPFPSAVNLPLALAIGVFTGFILPPMSMHTASMHMGYSLSNIGFAGGIFAFLMVCVLKFFGMESSSAFLWQEGRPVWIVGGLIFYFSSTFLFGLLVNQGKKGAIREIMRHPGRAVADFVLMDGTGAALMNMGLVGLTCVAYILLIQGDFSGPVIGAIFTVFGYGAFGAHLRNYLPVMAGVFLISLVGSFAPSTPGIQLAAVFSASLAPVAGQFGKLAGASAGMLHAAVALCTAELYGGLNLYNNGFSAGWVAIIMIPCLESFMKHFEARKPRKKEGKSI